MPDLGAGYQLCLVLDPCMGLVWLLDPKFVGSGMVATAKPKALGSCIAARPKSFEFDMTTRLKVFKTLYTFNFYFFTFEKKILTLCRAQINILVGSRFCFSLQRELFSPQLNQELKKPKN